MNHIEQLQSLISQSVSPYHCILASSAQLQAGGFKELNLASHWELEQGGSYYINVFDSTLIAFKAGTPAVSGTPSLKIAASHTDWPCFKCKPSPEVTSGRYGKLNTEVYGGPLLHTWFDRPLSMAGKVCSMEDNGSGDSLKTVFVDFHRPMLTIPSLAIHMNREANQGTPVNPQIDTLPLLTILEEKLESQDYFINALAKEAGVKKEDILDYEIYLYNAEEGCPVGLHEEFFSSPRLDNLTSVQACLTGIMESQPKPGSIDVIALYDNEEIGSSTKQGAASSLMDRILEKLLLALGYSREQYLNALFGGFLLSMDVAHAIHPNRGEKCDIKNQILMNDGIAIKLASSQSYATDASSTGVIETVCRRHGIPYKKFSNRSDMKGGSTLGSISSAFLNMRTVDVGIPMLAMHSAREVMGMKDQEALVKLAAAFFGDDKIK